jgi:ADP-dependent NAD(P)H-hydrate dehydratase / NAD(P)H-hydrate epimerase
MKVCSLHEMQDIDRRALAEFGMSESIVMENAGLAAFDVLQRQRSAPCKRVVVLCGSGNTAGAGLVAARRFQAEDAHVKVFILGDPARMHELSRTNLEVASRCGVPWQRYDGAETFRRALHGCDAIIDALLGPDLQRDVTGEEAEAITVINRAHCPTLSLDVPSGVCGDTGQVRGVAIDADMTLVFGLPKRGNVMPPGASRCGRLFVSHLTYPPQLQNTPELSVELVRPAPLPPRSPHGHKGSFGDTTFVAGAANYFGAPSFAAMACLRAGGGYARLACPGSMVASLASLAPEVVFVPQAETDSGSLARDNLTKLLSLANQADFVVLGPGLSLQPETLELVRELARGIIRPLLIDGDGLTAIAPNPELIRERAALTVVTPHPGEMGRLLGLPTREVLVDPIGAAIRGATQLGADVVLKGAHTVVAQPNGRASINTSGNDGMGTAGSGDVLTGTIAAMHGLGLPFHDAVATGVFLHGLAGDLAKEEMGADGITARDILGHLPQAVRQYRERYEEVTTRYRGYQDP